MYGWAGRILHIDLASRKTWVEELPKDLGARFLGARGINAKLLWDLIRKPGIDPFGPENVLIFGAGTLTGTVAPSSGRTTVTCKGPITGLYLKSNMGGHWGAELKFAGYDHVILHESSKRPVYVWINNNVVEIEDASHLWGLNVRETNKALKHDLGDNEMKVACIGPAGENLVRFAAIMSSFYHAAGRGGAGAVMGSKKLKAIAVRGTGTIMIKEADKFKEVAFAARESLAKDSGAQSLYDYGTSGSMEGVNELHAFPNYNFRLGHLENIHSVTGQNLVEKGYLVRRVGCFSCTISCHRYCRVAEGPYAGTASGGPEYETLCALGGGTWVLDTEAVLKANELCNLLGLDTISTGNIIQWAMETYEKGLLTKKETDGIDLKFGNAEALIKTVEAIGNREGKIGSLLAEGVKRAAEKVGKNSWKWAICNSKGLEQSSVETRSAKAYALAFAVNPRGPDHLHTEPFAEFGASPEAVALIEKLTGDKKWALPYYTEHRPEIVRWHEDCYAVTDSLGFCAFASTSAYGVTPRNMAEMFSLATGIAVTEEEIMLAGRRIVTAEKCFNVREGADRKLDDLPWRLMHEPAASGSEKGFMNSEEEMNGMLDKYYALHGWDLETSWPYKETLNMLDLKEVAEELQKLDKLPKHEKRQRSRARGQALHGTSKPSS
ncbi:MAG: aldehyde ferredoxin oxidoreductase family protein [Aigarchaeota archaeon]|nr:aldehyde ferredoxin oxidoreductase family protein [Aigarchaeota archaeon]